LVRFLENHDEPRASATMPPQKERAAAVMIATLPGATLWHEGQFEGRRARPPVFLARRPDEPPDGDMGGVHRGLLAAVPAPGIRTGEWGLLDCTGWPDTPTHDTLLAGCWWGAGRHIVIVNLSDHPAEGRAQMPWNDLQGKRWQLSELL